jgi:hypothetical protein
MTEATVDSLVEYYTASNFEPGNYYLLKFARHILRQLLLRQFSIAEIKIMSQTDFEAIDLEWPEKQDKTNPDFDVTEWLQQMNVSRTELITFLRQTLVYTQMNEEEADRLILVYMPEFIDRVTEGTYVRSFARSILRQLLLRGFSIADLKIMEHSDIEELDLEWLGQQSVAGKQVIASLKSGLLYRHKR